MREAIEQASIIRARPAGDDDDLHRARRPAAGAGETRLATISTLFLTPVAYLLLGRFLTAKTHEETRLQCELEEAAYVGAEPAQ